MAVTRSLPTHKPLATMKLFFSGSSHGAYLPENALASSNNGQGPCIMLTYHELCHRKNNTGHRFKQLLLQRKGKEADGKVACHFLDSGAHSLYTLHVMHQYERLTDAMREKLNKMTATERSAFKREQAHLFKTTERHAYKFFYNDEFWKLVDKYAAFLKNNEIACEYYANLDVIFNPKLTRRVQRYLEDKHHLNPIPVVHAQSDPKWLKLYLQEGYQYIALGGPGSVVDHTVYRSWANDMFSIICQGPKRLPTVKVHGFATTDYDLFTDYPWYSSDSSTWAKNGAYGLILVPHKRNGKHIFNERPYSIAVSMKSAQLNQDGRHFHTLKGAERKVVTEWLDKLEIPLGSIDKHGDMKEWGVCSHHGARQTANLWFFKRLEESLPDWPHPFRKVNEYRSFGL
jgi:hypothetical protein